MGANEWIIKKCSRRRFVIIVIVLSVVSLYVTYTERLIRVPFYIKNQSNAHVRIYCLILTVPKHFNTRARAVNSTWAKRCDRHFFISESSNDTKGLLIAPLANITPGYSHLTQKTTLALHYVYENFADDYDWIFKADDDTYLFVENLQLFLKDKNSSEPITYGYNFKIIVRQGYHSGGGGYVLSQEAVKRFYQAHQNPNTTCVKDGGAEDVEVAGCLRTVGVYPGKSVDEHNRERFHVLGFTNHFLGPLVGWLDSYAENKPVVGPDCCSNSTISFHYVSPEQQYLIDKMHYGFQDNTKDDHV